MSHSHIKSILPLKQFCMPVTESCKFLAHYDIVDADNLYNIRPLGAYPDIPGTTLFFDFSKQQDTAYDLSGNDNHGTIYGCTWVNGMRGKALDFNGVDQAVKIPWQPTNYHSISLWFYKDSWGADSYETLIGGPSGYELESKSSTTNSPVIMLYSWGKGTAEYELNRWNHLVFVRTPSDSKLYLNGNLVITGTAGALPSGNYFVGAWRDKDTQNFKGKIASVIIYNRELSADEISNHYNDTISILRSDGKYGGCVAVEQGAKNYLAQSYSGLEVAHWEAGVAAGYNIDDYPVHYFDGTTVTYTYTRDAVLSSSLAELSGQVVTFSTYIRTTNGAANVMLRVYDNVSGYTNITLPITNKFQRLSATKTFGTDPTRIFVMVDGEGQYEFYKPQLELGSFPTSFIDGAREAGKLMYPNPIPTVSQFTISFWGKLGEPYTGAPYDNILSIDKSNVDANNLHIDYMNGALRFFTYDSAGSAQVASHAIARSALKDWNHYAVIRDKSNLYGYLNGVEVCRVANSGTVNLDGYMQFGVRLSPGGISNKSNILVDELRVDNRALGADEIYAIWVSDAPHWPRGIHHIT